jgi:hypothetical protein
VLLWVRLCCVAGLGSRRKVFFKTPTLLVVKRNIRPKHRSAWERVAYYLRTGTPWTQLGAQPPPANCSKIWPAFATNLKARWPANPTAWRSGTQKGAVTGLHALSGMHLNLDCQAMGARDEVAEYVRALDSSNQSGAITSHHRWLITLLCGRCRTL